ncbi:hypothetical protein [Clostridium hydrogeniformans]|uniref:hypothetical protein n=1 Tax=Clostridium hydrogeniformans TaxID=349933 RepID=UPI000690ABA2|nr:hypothetical protein [Clostridium hydrogeniformans]
MEDKKKQLIEVYNILTSSGVYFYYDSEDIQYGEVTNMYIGENSNMFLQIDFEKEYEITLEDFQIYHSKENINYYDWTDIRKFDEILDELN